MHRFDPMRFDVAEAWPDLDYASCRPTLETLHRWLQIVGKVRLVLAPPVNHFWHSGMYVTPRGLSTGSIPVGPELLELEFDFHRDHLHLRTSTGAIKGVPLHPRTVAGFYREVMSALQALGMPVEINTRPDEVSDALPLDEDDVRADYQPGVAHRYHRALMTTDALFQAVRGRFLGKASPVFFYWGGNDLAVSFYSGRHAPERPGADAIARESHSHEMISVGFWPGDERHTQPVFYGYIDPEPPGFDEQEVVPSAAYYHADLREFLLPWDDVRRAESPCSALIAFCESVVDAGSTLAGWDRDSLFGRVPPTAHEVPPPLPAG